MATALSPAQTITASGQSLIFTCPPNQLLNPSQAVIYNKSSYELLVMGALIPAWGIVPVDLGALLGGATILPMTSVLAAGVTAAPVATVYVLWADQSEQLPPQQSFTADAIAAAIAGTISQTSAARLVSNGTTTANPVLNLLTSDRSLVFVVKGANAQTLLSVSGLTSGIDWSSQVNPGQGSLSVLGQYYIPVIGAIDPQVQVFWGAVGGGGNSYWIMASPDQLLPGTPGLPLFTVPYDDTFQRITQLQHASIIVNNSTATIISTPTVNTRWRVTHLSVDNAAAGQNAFLVGLGSGGVYWQTELTAAGSGPSSFPLNLPHVGEGLQFGTGVANAIRGTITFYPENFAALI